MGIAILKIDHRQDFRCNFRKTLSVDIADLLSCFLLDKEPLVYERFCKNYLLLVISKIIKASLKLSSYSFSIKV